MPLFEGGEQVAPLTAAEKKWCRDLEKLLLNCPERFGLYTIGDPALHIYDRPATRAAGIPEEECLPTNRGYGLATIRSRKEIQGWCG